jgi:hypothetical protein
MGKCTFVTPAIYSFLRMLRAVASIVHENATVVEAMELAR